MSEKRHANLKFAERFRDLLKETDTTLLVSELGLSSSSAFRQWTNGYSIPTGENLIKIAGHFNCSTDYLLGLSDYRNENEQEAINKIKNNLAEVLKLLPVETCSELIKGLSIIAPDTILLLNSAGPWRAINIVRSKENFSNKSEIAVSGSGTKH